MNKDYWKGWHDGKENALTIIEQRFSELQRTKGIGRKTAEKVKRIMEGYE